MTREARWPLTLLAVAVLFLSFGLLAEEVMEGETAAFDRRLLLVFRDSVDVSRLLGPRWLPEVLRDITSLGSTVILAIVMTVVLGYLAFAKDWRSGSFILMAVLGGQAISTLLKLAFERARPDLIPGAPQVFTASFPSGHAMLSAVTYLTIAVLLARIEPRPALKRYFLLVGFALAIIVGISRVALGVHWPTDVLAGWVVGSGWALLCAWIATRLQLRGKLPSASDGSPGR
jgi:undecaprenyl-diphosphatase